jgi:hypothetical protein
MFQANTYFWVLCLAKTLIYPFIALYTNVAVHPVCSVVNASFRKTRVGDTAQFLYNTPLRRERME